MNDDELLEELFSMSQYSAPSPVKLREGPSVNTASASRKTGHPPAAASTAAPLPSTLPIPAELESKLFDYQKEGVAWLYERHRKGRGCLLADEMGLGKTVQVATFLGALYHSKLASSTIIVVPPTLLSVWESALKIWGRLGAPIVEIVHNDTKTKRQQRWRRLKHGTACVFLTTYGVLRQDSQVMSVRMIDYVVMDEAHLIKDASTQVFQSSMTLSSRHRIAVTGTPLMNNFEDLWSIFQFVDGGILNTSRAEFRTINTALLRGNERDAGEKERGEAAQQLSLLQAAIRPFMLRRDKRHVQALSAGKRDLVVWLRLSDVQQRRYEALVDGDRVAAALHNADPSQPLVLLTALMLTCEHPWLSLTPADFRTALRNPLEIHGHSSENDSDENHTDSSGGSDSNELGWACDLFGSCKIDATLALVIRCIGEGRKTLVFSRSKRLLDIVAIALRHWLIDFARLDGDVPPELRVKTIDAFNRDRSQWVCLLTTQVGGVGLTVEAASAVVLLDPSWNPSTDAQAIDRVHRIGQTRDVVVYRLATCGTVEEKVYRNQVFKAMAAKQGTAAALSAAESAEFYRYFTHLQLRSMFAVGALDHSETAAQLECLHPGAVRPEERAALAALPHVQDVSDNSCVLVEAVTEPEEGEERERGPEGVPARRRAGKRPRSAAQSSGVAQLELSEGEVADVLLQLEECGGCGVATDGPGQNMGHEPQQSSELTN